jgi:Tfp pilus assembly protein PilN
MNLNLATHPARNRRLFFLLTGIVAHLLGLLLILGIGNVIRYGFRARTVRAAVQRIDREISQAERETKQLEGQIAQAIRERQRQVDNFNQLIYRKSFSWLELLGALEELLPPACYIDSLAPVLEDDADMDLRFKVAAPNFKTLETLMERLYAKGFKDLRLVNEVRGPGGFIIFEMSVRYERDI